MFFGKIKKTKFISKMSDYACELFYFVFMTSKKNTTRIKVNLQFAFILK